MSTRRFPLSWPVLIAILVTLALTLVLALDLWPPLRGGAGWRWPYQAPDSLTRLWPGIIALALYLALGGLWLARLDRGAPSRGATAAFIAFCVAGGLGVQLAFLSFYGNPLEHLFLRTISIASGGFFGVGALIENLIETWRAYPALMPTWPAHPKAHPPGIVTLFWAAGRLFALAPGLAGKLASPFRIWQCHHRVLMALPDASIDSALLGMALPLLSLLALPFVYDLTRQLYDRAAALRAVLWLPLVPALVMFTPQWNQFYILLTMLGLWLTHRALRDVNPWWLGLAGLVMSAATFTSFTNVNIVGLMGVYGGLYVMLIGARGWDAAAWKRLGLGVGLFVAGLALVWVIYYAVSGVTIFELLTTALTIHYGLNEPYWPWLFFFPEDLLLFTGLALGGLAIIQMVTGVRNLLRHDNDPEEGDVLALAVLISVLVLNFSGLVRGEVGRLLLWIMPLLVILAARTASQAPKPRPTAWTTGAALGVQLVVMVAVLPVIGTELAPPPDPPFVSEPPLMMFETQAAFDGRADLIGYNARLTTDRSAMDLTLFWRSTGRFDHAYFLSAVVIGPDGQPHGVADWLPVDGGYPTSCWRPGEIVTDTVQIPLDSAPSGDYWISVAMYDFDTGERLTVTVPGLPPDTQVGLGPVPCP